MPKFEIQFVDGKKVVKEANTADEAKRQAKNERRAPMPRDTPGSAPEVKVTSVTRLQDETRGRDRDDNRDSERAREDRERNDRDRGEGNNRDTNSDREARERAQREER